jgi:quinol monooxygenase YgiN
MYVLVWEFRVDEARRAPFEAAYGGDGDWARLFRRGEGYLRTELLRDAADPLRFLTIDCWTSRPAYEAFRAAHAADYAALDRRCANLTRSETALGGFDEA